MKHSPGLQSSKVARALLPRVGHPTAKQGAEMEVYGCHWHGPQPLPAECCIHQLLLGISPPFHSSPPWLSSRNLPIPFIAGKTIHQLTPNRLSCQHSAQ